MTTTTTTTTRPDGTTCAFLVDPTLADRLAKATLPVPGHPAGTTWDAPPDRFGTTWPR